METQELSVWAGLIFSQGKRQRCLVAADNKKDAVKLLNAKALGITLSHFNSHWKETSHLVELKVANDKGVWVNKDSSDNSTHFDETAYHKL